MIRTFLLCGTLLFAGFLFSQTTIEKEYFFSGPQITTTGDYTLIGFNNTLMTAQPGEPVLPYQSVSLLLPPGKTAVAMEISGFDETTIPGFHQLYPQQYVQPVSQGSSGSFIRNDQIYSSDNTYPQSQHGQVLTCCLNGYAFALSSFTPVKYHPASGRVSYFQRVKVSIRIADDPNATTIAEMLSASQNVLDRVEILAQNPESINLYPQKDSPESNYQILIITPSAFTNDFQPLINRYQNKSMLCQLATIESISQNMSGADLQEKIRNYIIQEYQNNSVEYVLLGGDAEHVPYRGFYCQVQSSSLYEDTNIPSDLYYSALDGNWNTNSNNLWGEPGEDDLLPDIAVTRFPFSTQTELGNMINKSISYQDQPVEGELDRPFIVAEHLYFDPMTFGQDYLELIIDDHNDNGYFTHGIPTAENTIERMYDTLISPPANIYSWNTTELLETINQGKSFIHHCGHSNVQYMMRLMIWDITDQTFNMVNGTDHNYTLMYTHGCLCGAFDEDDCIAEKSVTIENFLVAGVFNSRYGWFNEGQTEGPSAHLHREFISALYTDTMPQKRIGATHMISKIKTAPWVTAPGQWEPGALRWCFYCCNVFGDPAMEIWTDNPPVAVNEKPATEALFSVYPNPSSGLIQITADARKGELSKLSILNGQGKELIRQDFRNEKSGNASRTFDVSSLSPGMYMLKVVTGNETHTAKLIIVK
jgi:hypothetical protein